MPICSDLAWNNFVMRNDLAAYGRGDIKRAAAIAAVFMSAANSGGLNSFLTSSYDLDASEVVEALTAVGATQAAHQLTMVLNGLGGSLPASSQEVRWTQLVACWSDELDQHDVFNTNADAQLLRVLRAHVAANEAHYEGLK